MKNVERIWIFFFFLHLCLLYIFYYTSFYFFHHLIIFSLMSFSFSLILFPNWKREKMMGLVENSLHLPFSFLSFQFSLQRNKEKTYFPLRCLYLIFHSLPFYPKQTQDKANLHFQDSTISLHHSDASMSFTKCQIQVNNMVTS
jgi:hypothetical protein